MEQVAPEAEQTKQGQYAFLSNVSDTLGRHDSMLTESTKAIEILNNEARVANTNVMQAVVEQEKTNRLFGIIYTT